MLLWCCIAVRILSNPLSNVFQKLLTRRSADPVFLIFAVLGLLTLASTPIFLLELPELSPEFWFWMTLCTLLTVSGNVLIVQAVKLTDLSVLGPINSYKAVVSLVPSIILLGEIPGWMGLCGIALILAGSYFIVDRDPAHPGRNVFVRFFKDRGVQYRFAALILSALEAVVIKKALLLSSPLTTFGFWSLFGFCVSGMAIAVMFRRERLGQQFEILRTNKRFYLLLALTTGLMQSSTIFVLSDFQVGYTLALFQTSTIISVLLGWRVFQESHFLERLIGSIIMLAGAVLIVLG